MELDSQQTVDNTERSRFELKVEGHFAYIDYKVGNSGRWYLIHTEVPKEITLKGVGNKIVRETLDILDWRGAKIIPFCPFVKAFIKRHWTDYGHLVADGYNMEDNG